MASDPRVHKPRLPKAYTDQQLAFLKGSLPEFERRSQGSIRGDAKKFALERAQDFIVRFGLPDEFVNIEEPESRFKEQIYNWFKNTVGRTRRKLEGRPRSAKKAAEKAAALANDLAWNSSVATPNVVPYSHAESSTSSPVNQAQTLISPIQYGGIQPSSSMQQNSSMQQTAPMQSNSSMQQNPSMQQTPTMQTNSSMQPTPMQPSPSMGPPPQALANPNPTHTLSTLGLSITQSTIRETFLQGVDSSTVANMIQSFIASAAPSSIPLTPVVDALFDAISESSSPNPFSRDPLPYLKHFLEASSYFTSSVIHAGVSGPLAGPRALQMQIRKNSVWTPTPSAARGNSSTSRSTPVVGVSSGSASLSDEMQRIALDRQRRKDHIQWARIHAAALELNMLGLGRASDVDNTGYAYAMGRAFSEMTARDAVWEPDEVEWVAGICVLRSVIRTAICGDRRQRDEYDELLRTYEGRWKEIKDEARQGLCTEVLLSAKDELARLDNSLS
ncbi:unnamed protein product [Cyclocybe aegerita]|uniref:Uncharacterized protein n=1 Tax=Cyclocybe aegerita TaxID=1973307 RepID=A0A8S0X4W0_CYCAE|nr:unnamed protein product [Cyclocybe aegerita]